MEKETIIVSIEINTPAGVAMADRFDDCRKISLETTRGEITKKIDEICADLEATFEH